MAFPLACLTPCSYSDTSSCGPPHLFRPILGKMSSFVSSATTKLAYSKGSHQGENLPRKRISRLGISSLSPTARKIAAAAQAKRTTTPSKSMRSLAWISQMPICCQVQMLYRNPCQLRLLLLPSSIRLFFTGFWSSGNKIFEFRRKILLFCAEILPFPLNNYTNSPDFLA